MLSEEISSAHFPPRGGENSAMLRSFLHTRRKLLRWVLKGVPVSCQGKMIFRLGFFRSESAKEKIYGGK